MLLFRTFLRLVLLALILCPGGLLAQTPGTFPSPPDPDDVGPASDSVEAQWKYETLGKFSFSQAAYKDWKEGGGVNSLAFTTSLEGTAERAGERWAHSHDVRLVLGFLNQENRELRKSEDLIRLQSALRYHGGDFFQVFSPTLAVNLRTQFASGFNYSDNPYPEPGENPAYPVGHPKAGEEPPVKTSAFFAPATLTESLGLTYEPTDAFQMRLGGASKQTIVAEPDFRIIYGVDRENVARVEAGAEFASSLDYRIMEDVRYRGRLNVFFSFNQSEKPPDMIWENVVNLQVNDWLSTDLEFVALYDQNTTQAIQLKEVISVGISFSLL